MFVINMILCKSFLLVPCQLGSHPDFQAYKVAILLQFDNGFDTQDTLTCPITVLAIKHYNYKYIFCVQGAFNAQLPTIVMGSISLMSGFLVFLLPETRGVPLPFTIREVEEIVKNKDKKTTNR